MQPYFFPYLGYFQLLQAVDRWVVFDDIQYVNRGWINRNRVLHPNPEKEWQYVTVPLHKLGRFDRICDVAIKQELKWQDELLGKLTAYRKRAPFYDQTMEFVSSCLLIKESNLSKFVVHTLKETASYLGIDTPITVQSELVLDLHDIEHAGQWALRIAEELGASEYVNPLGGVAVFRDHEFSQAGIDLNFLRPCLADYSQRREKFLPGLSIIDVLMWNDRAEVRDMLHSGVRILNAEEAKYALSSRSEVP